MTRPRWEAQVDVLDQIAAGDFAEIAKRWVSPFRSAFPDFEMEVVDLIAEGDRVVAHFRCSGTHRGEWLGVPGTGRRFDGAMRSTSFAFKTASWCGETDLASGERRLAEGEQVGAPRRHGAV